MMRNRRNSTGQLLLLLLSFVGAGIAIYLTFVHYENIPLLCSSSGVVDCARVLSSSYSLIPGTTIPITVPGLGWCLVMGVLAIAALRLGSARRTILVAQFAWSVVGILTVLYLVYVELVRLHTICAWCTALHVVILLMLLITIVQLQQVEPEAEMEPESEAPKLPASR
jgi:uncharacterized membrane protein